jgi:transposase
MLLAHRIRLDPTPVQRDYFARAAGTARRVWNWALAEWQRQTAAGQRPDAMALKKQFNAIKYVDQDWLDGDGHPWLRTIHRDAHAQPFANLAKAWNRYFVALREHRPAHPPVFKKKGRWRDSFYVANDRMRLDGKRVVLPKVGAVALREPLRWPGKIVGASVSREADHWLVNLADRWYPSSKLCSRCGTRYGELSLSERTWSCDHCGAQHDRDVNAATNLQRLATGACAAQSALPVASLAATPGTAADMGSAGGGKVTPVRHEHGQQDGSGQEQNGAHL